ncbi:MAG: Xylose isomerase-like TIM barrel [Eubacteriales bacterium]|jgi:hypothetical protein
MEYRHKLIRTAVGILIDKAIRDIQSDPGRSIRNLADMGDNFSKSPAQKRFFKIVHEILKDPGNPYYELLLNMTRNVWPDTVKTVSLNFGYTGLNYGAEILRGKEAAAGKSIPWLLRFDCSKDGENALNFREIDKILTDSVSLGIYTCVIKLGECGEKIGRILELCKNHRECCIFVAMNPTTSLKGFREPIMKTPNLIFSVDMTEGGEVQPQILRDLHEWKCFYGFHAYYNTDNVNDLTSDRFTRSMIGMGCIFGCYVNRDFENQELEEQVYRYVCSRRGKKGEPLFVFDFNRDEKYISDTILCGTDLCVGPDGKARLAGGRLADMHRVLLSDMVKTPGVQFVS